MNALNLTVFNQTSAHTPDAQTTHPDTGIVPTLRTPFLYEGSVEAGGIVLVEVPLYAEHPVHLRAEATGLTPESDPTAIDLDLYVLDRFGICVAADTTVGRTATCEFTPLGSGKHLLKLVNSGASPVAFALYAFCIEAEVEVTVGKPEVRRAMVRSAVEEERTIRCLRRDRQRRADRRERQTAKRAFMR